MRNRVSRKKILLVLRALLKLLLILRLLILTSTATSTATTTTTSTYYLLVSPTTSKLNSPIFGVCIDKDAKYDEEQSQDELR